MECEEDNRCSRSSILPPFPPPTKGRKFYFRGLAFGVSIFVLPRDQKKSLLPLRIRPTAIGVCVFLPPLVDCDDDIRGGGREREEEEASSDVGKRGGGGGGGGEARGATSENVESSISMERWRLCPQCTLAHLYLNIIKIKNLIICVKNTDFLSFFPLCACTPALAPAAPCDSLLSFSLDLLCDSFERRRREGIGRRGKRHSSLLLRLAVVGPPRLALSILQRRSLT